MRICTLLPSYERSESPFRELDPYPDPSIWAPEHDFTTCMVDKATAVRTVRKQCRSGFDVFVNLCDGAWEEDSAGIEVAIELERQEQAYTGASPDFFEPSRKALKLLCPYVGIDTPRYVFAKSQEETALAAAQLRFPLLVKHPNGYGSIGLTRASRVTTADDLFAVARGVIEQYGGALIEEFIDGREFTVLVAEPGAGESVPRCYPPLEIGFPKGESFKHFDLKWCAYEEMSALLVKDDALAGRLQNLAAAIFEGFKGVGYARCDVRMDADGRLFLIDVNPNPGVFYPPHEPGAADLILQNAPGGHPGFLAHILDSALRRRDRRRRKWSVRHHPETGYGLVATENIAAGERVLVREERPHQLVSRSHVERHWPRRRIDVFRQCAYPVSEDLYVMWSGDPEAWFPTNHSCDPSAMLDGLDFVARQPIRKGEAITLDYATFAGPNLVPFECKCGSPACRKIIRDSDPVEPVLEARHGEYMQDWAKRAGGSR